MKLTDNNALNVLIVVNIVALIAIFTLLWVLWKNGIFAPAEQSVINDVGNKQEEMAREKVGDQKAEKTLNKKLTMAEKISLEVASAEKLLKEKASENNSSIKNIEEVESLDEVSDIEYVIQYQKTKNDVQPKRNIDDKDVTTVKVLKNTERDSDIEFNNIDVSGLKNSAEMLDTITTRIASLMTDEKKQNNKKSVKPKNWDDYLSAIKSAEVERKNEMRMIRVKAGESLWEIAVRAYGNGFLYKKIFEANPQLTNPDLIVAGQMLRVPL